MTTTTNRRSAWLVAGALWWTGIASAQVSNESRQQSEREAYNCALANDCNGQTGNHTAAPRIWGALALSRSTLISGGAWAYSSEREAKDAALAFCHRKMNAMRDCAIVSTFRNACIALATSEHASGVSPVSRTAKAAQTAAIDQCVREGGKTCAVTLAFCSPSGAVKITK